MASISRRQFVRLGTAAGLSALVPICLVPTASASAAGVALAVAAVIASMIAANNRRSTEALLLGALSQQMRVATEQLASLQTAVSFLLRDFANLRSDIEEMLRREAIILKQDEIKTNINLYVSHLNVRQKYKSDLDWLNSSRREQDLSRILHDLNKARVALITSSTAIDPSSALVLAPCALAELNLMNICNIKSTVYDSITFLSTIKAYEEQFGSIKDPTINESTAWYLADRETSKQNALSWLASNPIWAQLASPAGVYHPCVTHRVSGLGGAVGESRISQRVRSREINVLDDPAVKSKLQQLKITPAADDGAFPVRQLIFEPGESDVLFESGSRPMGSVEYLVTDEVRPGQRGWTGWETKRTKNPWKYGDDCLPARSANIEVLPLRFAPRPQDLPTPDKVRKGRGDVRKALENSTEWKKIIKEQTELQDHIEQFNTDTAKIVYAKEALASVDATLKSLQAVKRSFR